MWFVTLIITAYLLNVRMAPTETSRLSIAIANTNQNNRYNGLIDSRLLTLNFDLVEIV